ncbi:hypothetical protein FBH03_10330, partial [Campylobacter coli]|nr:hypothetical protein [Campylobacter coli]
MNEGIEIHFAKVNFHIKEFQKVLLGRLEFLQRNQDKAGKHKDIIKDLQNPQQASNDKQNDKTKSRTKNKQKQTTT